MNTYMLVGFGLFALAIFSFVGTIWFLVLLGVAGGIAKAAWKTALKMWKWVAKKSAPKSQGSVVAPQAQPQQSRDTRPLPEVPPNWHKTSKLAFCKLDPTLTSPTPPTPITTTSITLPPIPF